MEPTGSLLGDTVTDGGNVDTGLLADVTNPKPDMPIWHEQLSAELKGHEVLSGIANVNDLGAKHVELAGKLNDAIFKPGEGASAAVIQAYREKMGIPESPEGYKIVRPELPEGLPYDESVEKEALKVFHQAGISQEAAQTAMDFFNNMVIEAYKQMEVDSEKARTDTKAALEKEWGDKLKPNVQLAERLLDRPAAKDFKLRLEEKGLAYDPATYKFLHDIAKGMSEDSLMAPADGGGNDGPQRLRDGTPMLDFPSMKGSTA